MWRTIQSWEGMMNRRRRLLTASLLAVAALSLAVSAAFATVTTYWYGSTWSQTSPSYTGALREYSGNQLHIQLTASAATNGTYWVEPVYKTCQGPICWWTQDGGEGACPYNGFCGLTWNINLNAQYMQAFYFQKYNDNVNVHCNNSWECVQMWSTTP
jgi:hypothetical protein